MGVYIMNENIDKLNGKDKKNIIIESGLQLIPYVGGAIATAYFGTKQAKAFERLERFYKELSDEFFDIKEKIASVETQDEDALVALIEQVNDSIEHEHQESKINDYKKFMKNLLINPVNSSNYDKRKVFLDVLNNMSILECELIALLYSADKLIQVKQISKPNVNQYAIVGAINKLKSYGFLKTTQGSFSVGGGDNLLQENVMINDYGKEFVAFTIV